MAAVDDHRPQKRPRTNPTTELAPGPVDHIFIADGVSAKKANVKKIPLSCCECRRLKLKCDRNFPCASCKKRGCAEICPDGVLVSGKGTRFILANTEQLHTKIHEMSDRIRLLEDALGKLHHSHEVLLRRCSNPDLLSATHNPWPGEEEEMTVHVHPLLHPDLLSVKSSMELYSNIGNTGQKPDTVANGEASMRGSLSSSVEKAASKQGGSQEDPSHSIAPGRVDSEMSISVYPQFSSQTSGANGNLAAQVIQLGEAFPLSTPASWDTCGGKLAMREYIRSQAPSKPEAKYLWEQASKKALWQYNPHPSATFFSDLAHHIQTSPVADLCPARLSLFFVILAVGSHVDQSETGHSLSSNLSQLSDTHLNHAKPKNAIAKQYHHLGRASLCEVPMMEETDVNGILALFWEIWYLLAFSDSKIANSLAWGTMGLMVKLAQKINLHRDCGGKSKTHPEETEVRRALFWELLYLDARLALSLGRPPSISIQYFDTQRPSYSPEVGTDFRFSMHHYQQWKHSYFGECLSPVLDALSRPTVPPYSDVLALDRRVRDFPIPDVLRSWNDGRLQPRALTMQKGSVCTAIEAVLLQLHRKFFFHALSAFDEAFNRKHRFAPSVLAVFLSASRMIASIQDLYQQEPSLTSKIKGYWNNAFSSTVMLCLLISRAPFTCLSPAALQEIERARRLFRAAKDRCLRASQVLPILESMVEQANDTYYRWQTNQDVPTVILKYSHDDPSREPTTRDPFVNTHPSLAQCILEVHERGKSLFPLRKPCQCGDYVAEECPPNLPSWMPDSTPSSFTIPQPSSAPPESSTGVRGHYGTGPMYAPTPGYRHVMEGMNTMALPAGNPRTTNFSVAPSTGLYSSRVLPVDSPVLQLQLPISTQAVSSMEVTDMPTFDLAALSVEADHEWMTFF